MPMPMGTPKKIRKKQTPETQFHSSLTLCSKHKDLPAAISLYKSALSQNTRLNHHHFNTLLYLCSNSVSDPSLKQLASENGFRMFDHMLSIGILPNEATITAVARLGWDVRRATVDLSSSQCSSCGERLVCVDIDCGETERFAQSVAALAMEREVQSNFSEFQDWLDKHTEYEAIVDGANIGLYQQNFADGGFSLTQLDVVVKELYNRSEGKWPLVVMHNRRFRGLVENPYHRKLVEEWMGKGILYATPSGSNDDWYWLYAAVKLKCLLVTNDEMRDHIFELLGSSFFLKWKERHQVRYTFVKGNVKLQMPPPYSSVIQESENGSWHVPIADESCQEPARTWLCITRPSVSKACGEVSQNLASSQSGVICNNHELLRSCTSESVASHRDKTTFVTGKRKERSPSPSRINISPA